MSLSVLFATSEAYPLIKTGGLADVSGALPAALTELGVDVRLVLPRYGDLALREDQTTEHLARLDVLGQPVDILHTVMPDSGVRVYLVDHPTFSARQGNPYMGPDGNSWHDNPDRFALFARAAVAVATGEVDPDWRPDVVHANDWQTGLIPALLHEAEKPQTVFTLHNLAYQGVFDRSTFERLGLPWSLWRPDGLEFWGNMSFIKGGIVFADRITTVSPNYAREIQTPEFGYGLDGLLRHRRDSLVGILNGIGSDWNPETDPALVAPYSRETLDGKAANKAALQKELGLPIRDDVPLIVHVGRCACCSPGSTPSRGRSSCSWATSSARATNGRTRTNWTGGCSSTRRIRASRPWSTSSTSATGTSRHCTSATSSPAALPGSTATTAISR